MLGGGSTALAAASDGLIGMVGLVVGSAARGEALGDEMTPSTLTPPKGANKVGMEGLPLCRVETARCSSATGGVGEPSTDLG